MDSTSDLGAGAYELPGAGGVEWSDSCPWNWRDPSRRRHGSGRTCCLRVAPGSNDVDNQWPWETAECRAEVGGGSSSDDSRDNITRFERRASSQVCVTTSDDCEIAVSAINSPARVGQVYGLEGTLGWFANVGGVTECG
jgi:hypothetical protein